MKKKQAPGRYFVLRIIFGLITVSGILLCAFGSFIGQKINNWLVYSYLIGEELAVVQYGKLYRLQFGLVRASYSISPLAPSLMGNARFPEWSPDGEWIAFDYYEGEGWSWREAERSIYIVRADGTNLQRLTMGVSPQWDRSGRIIYYTDWSAFETIKSIDLDTGEIQDIFHSQDCERSGIVGNYRVSPINQAALLQIGGSTYEWMPQSQSCRQIVSGWDAVWSVRGDISSGSFAGGFNAFQRQPIVMALDTDRNSYWVHGGSPSWSPDGRYFVYDSSLDSSLIDWSLYVYDTETDDVYDLQMDFAHPAWRP